MSDRFVVSEVNSEPEQSWRPNRETNKSSYKSF